MKTKATRYFLVDSIRGFAIINMVIFHFLYDVYIVYEKNSFWYGLPIIHIWQQMICQTFIFISGFVWEWGKKSNLWRGLRFNLYGFLISFVTLTIIPSETIWFGILNFMGCAILLMFPLQKVIKRISPIWGLGSSFFLFIFCKQMQYGYLGIRDFIWIQIPKVFYSIRVFTPFGFPFPEFQSSDYFPIFPWIFLYLSGYFFNEIFREHNKWEIIAQYKIPFLADIGSRTIWIYLLHQPISILVCNLLFN